MNRKAMVKFINDAVLPSAEIADYDWFYNGREIFQDILKAIRSWRIGKPIDIEMNAKIIDGVLYINDEAVKRVAAKLPKKAFNECADYWEGKILSRT